MPAKQKDPKKHYQHGRTKLRRSIIMSPQAIADAAKVSLLTGDIYLSGAIARALRHMVERAEGEGSDG